MSAKPAGWEHLDFIEPEELVAQLKDQNSKTVVVDVREVAEGFPDSHIKGALNVPVSTFDTRVKEVQEQLAGAEQIVVHCLHSQRRGPSAASKIIEHLAKENITGPKVVVLSGGYHRFHGANVGNEEVLEGPKIAEPIDGAH